MKGEEAGTDGFDGQLRRAEFPVRRLEAGYINTFALCAGIGADINKKLFRVVRDRKSTRLNSSHLVISYAVFCLKKKKNYQAKTRLRSHNPSSASASR